MRRGTTPTHEFTTDTDLTSADVIYLTYKQGNHTVLELEKDRMTVTAESLSVTLTQEETLSFDQSLNFNIQIRARFPDQSAVASNIMNATAEAILKDGVI